MKAPAKVWRLSLLAAVLLHLLILAGWQMLRRRQTAPESLRAADDTPMLLQFSREEPLAQEAGTIPLPPAAPLPPPIGGVSPARSTLLGKDRGSAKPAAGSNRQATAARTLQGKSGARPGAPRTSARPVRARGSGTPEGSGASAPLPLALTAGSPARLALDKGLHEARSANAEEAPPAGREEKADPRSGGRNQGTEAEARAAGGDQGRPSAGYSAQRATPADLRLWSLARTRQPAPGSLEGLPAGLAIRELPLDQARGSGADIKHQRLVRLDDGLLLLWVEGTTVWLVRSPLP